MCLKLFNKVHILHLPTGTTAGLAQKQAFLSPDMNTHTHTLMRMHAWFDKENTFCSLPEYHSLFLECPDMHACFCRCICAKYWSCLQIRGGDYCAVCPCPLLMRQGACCIAFAKKPPSLHPSSSYLSQNSCSSVSALKPF